MSEDELAECVSHRSLMCTWHVTRGQHGSALFASEDLVARSQLTAQAAHVCAWMELPFGSRSFPNRFFQDTEEESFGAGRLTP